MSNSGQHIKIELPEEKDLREQLAKRTDAEAARIKRYLSMPDLSRTEGSPLKEMVDRIIAQADFKSFDIIEAPEIAPADISFDLFDFPNNHPARSHSDTYYIDDKYILRTHTTIMWYYHMLDENVKKKMAANEPVGAFCYGKVYRKDEIDRRHMNVFHQIDGWYLAPKEKEVIDEEDLKKVLSDIAKAVFGENVKYRFNPDTFPYTDPSLEMEIEMYGKWVEGNGCGVVKGSVLEKFGIDSTKWTGWAFGFGLERLAILSMDLPDIRLLWSKDPRVLKQLHLGNKYVEVSKYPPVLRDISFIVTDDNFVLNDYYDMIREVGGDLIEEVEQLDKYENKEKFGEGRTSYTFRITYRSADRTLEATEVEPLQAKIYELTSTQFHAQTR